MPKTLSDKRKNECQQCKKEHSKSHEVENLLVVIFPQECYSIDTKGKAKKRLTLNNM